MTKNIFWIFFCILENYIKVWTFSRKRWPSYLMYFWTYGLQKTWFDKCLKSPISGDHSTSNMVNRTQLCGNLNNSTLRYLLIPLNAIQGEKDSPSYMQNLATVFLTQWLPITSTLFLIDTIFSSIFICNYVRNEKFCLNFFVAFSKSRFNFDPFGQKEDPHSWCSFGLTDSSRRG